MPHDYSSVTIEAPTGYFIAHLHAINELIQKFPGVKIDTRNVNCIKVSTNDGTEHLDEVWDWVLMAEVVLVGEF